MTGPLQIFGQLTNENQFECAVCKQSLYVPDARLLSRGSTL